MVCGAVPFKANSMQDLYRNILKAEFTFPVQISREARDLIRRMLRRVPEERILIPEILSHPWVTKLSDQDSELNSTMSRRDCSNVTYSNALNGTDEDSMNTHEFINLINVDNLFYDEDYENKLNYEDYCSVTEDFATMHIDEDVLDVLEEMGYERHKVKLAMNKGEMNHATATYNLLTMKWQI